MTLTSGIRATIGTATIFTAMIAALALAFSAAPASAAPGQMIGALKITPSAKKHVFKVNVRGLVRMSQAEAQARIDSGHRITIKIWGSDPFVDDVELFYDTVPVATADGLRYEGIRITAEGELDEDIEGGDELYAGVRLVRASGKSVKSVQTNTWYGRFSRFAGYGGT